MKRNYRKPNRRRVKMKKLTHQEADKQIMEVLEESENPQQGMGRTLVDKLMSRVKGKELNA